MMSYSSGDLLSSINAHPCPQKRPLPFFAPSFYPFLHNTTYNTVKSRFPFKGKGNFNAITFAMENLSLKLSFPVPNGICKGEGKGWNRRVGVGEKNSKAQSILK
ncbi:hypothetical protein CEXT_387501 [Caerostris extrusa]|uniref:Uncharacterized protein n=1 Tax=Caerostris extrusa TaxID=172846 RepID=A0AAV4P4K0_CAEEX|nr:hypothetical protein CEXT_387501 [Caerostris extrusa]